MNNLNDRNLRFIFKVSNPKIPSLYCLPKTHKEGNKVRPIASSIRSPSYNIAKWLIKQFKQLNQPLGLDVKNSIELISYIRETKIKRTEILVSFDVESLYPSIPKRKAIEYLERWLLHQGLAPLTVNTYVMLAELCINQNYISFRNENYEQMEGVAMGNPISSFLANLFMCYFEMELSRFKNFPRVWRRYVDDVLCVVNRRKVQSTLDFLNSFHPSIKFTVELQNKNCELPFLELLIKYNDAGELNFKVYRKPSSTNRYITSNSNHNIHHKRAAFNCMIHRLLHIPMSKSDYDDELQTIYKIADINGYTKTWIDLILYKMIKQQRINQSTTHTKEKSPKKYIGVSFSPQIHYKIQNILSPYNIQISPKNNYKLSTYLTNTRDKTILLDKSGVYSIICNEQNCEYIYIGKSRRKVISRFKEHKRATTKLEPHKSAIAEHMIENHHSFEIENLDIMYECYNENRLQILESIFIQTYHPQEMLMNTNNTGLSRSCLFSLLKNNNKFI